MIWIESNRKSNHIVSDSKVPNLFQTLVTYFTSLDSLCKWLCVVLWDQQHWGRNLDPHSKLSSEVNRISVAVRGNWSSRVFSLRNWKDFSYLACARFRTHSHDHKGVVSQIHTQVVFNVLRPVDWRPLSRKEKTMTRAGWLTGWCTRPSCL